MQKTKLKPKILIILWYKQHFKAEITKTEGQSEVKKNLNKLK